MAGSVSGQPGTEPDQDGERTAPRTLRGDRKARRARRSPLRLETRARGSARSPPSMGSLSIEKYCNVELIAEIPVVRSAWPDYIVC